MKRVDKLGDTTRKQFVTAVPAGKRLSREKLASIANSYWAGLENNRGEKVPPFADDCLRLENGTQTSGVELAPGAKRTTINMPCGSPSRSATTVKTRACAAVACW